MLTPEKPKLSRPATERQKEYARELGIEFPDDITLQGISSLIGEAQAAQDEEKWNRVSELNSAEECRLSKATPLQMVQALSDEHDLAAILITMPWSQIKTFENLRGVESEIAFSDAMSLDDMESVILTYAGDIMKRKGIIK